MPNVWFAGGMLWVWRVMCAGHAMTCCLVFLSLTSNVTFLLPSSRYGESACIFASDERCTDVFSNIFKGGDSLTNLFHAFGPTVGLQMLFILCR